MNDRITTVLFDLDGVLIDYDQSAIHDIEQRHGLTSGALFSTAFEPVLLEQVITGKITRAAWFSEVGSRLGNHEATQDWYKLRGTVNKAVLGQADALRESGLSTAVLTNGTNETRELVRSLGILDRFDAFFVTSEIGFAKPDRRAFQHVCDTMAVKPTSVLFIDDSESKLAGAIEIGMATHHFIGVAGLRAGLREIA